MRTPHSRPLLAAAAAATFAVVVPGCAVGPDYTPPNVTVVPNFGELQKTTGTDPSTQPSRPHAMGEPVVEWWTTLRDPELSSLIERAVAENLDVQRATSRIRQARADVVIAGGRLLPQINASAGYESSRGSGTVVFPSGALGGGDSGSTAGGTTTGGGTSGTSSNSTASRAGRSAGNRPAAVSSSGGQSGSGSGTSGTSSAAGGSGTGGRGGSGESGLNPARGGPQSPLGEGGLPGTVTELYQIGFDATWELDVFGGVRRGVEAAGADLAAAVEDRRDVLTSLVAETARDYLQLRGYQQRLVIARQNLQSQRETLDLTMSRYKAGFATDLDVSRQGTEVSNTESTIPPLEAAARQSIHAISVLLARDPDALSSELSVVAPLPDAPPDVPVGLPSDLLKRRPDVRRAEQQIKAANARVGVATADLFPKFSITGGLGLDSSHAKHLFDWDSRYFIFSPGVSWALFEGGRIRANIKSQTEQRQQLMLSYQTTVLTALRETEDALVLYATEQTRRTSLVEAEKSARVSVDIARQQYKEGVADFLTVLDTQRVLLTTQDQLVQSDQTITSDLVALYKALGGGWEVDAARRAEADKDEQEPTPFGP